MTDSNVEAVRVPSVLEDPSIQVVARVYADSLLNSQGEPSGDDRVEELRSFVDDVLATNPEFERALISPMVSDDKKVALIDQVITPRSTQLFSNFLKVIAQHGRLDLIRVIYDVALEEQQKRSGKIQVVIRSAAPISDEKAEQIRAQLETQLSAAPQIEVQVDPSLLGGLIIQVGDTVYDSSIRNRLGQLQSRLRQRYVHEIQRGRDRFSHTDGN